MVKEVGVLVVEWQQVFNLISMVKVDYLASNVFRWGIVYKDLTTRISGGLIEIFQPWPNRFTSDWIDSQYSGFVAEESVPSSTPARPVEITLVRSIACPRVVSVSNRIDRRQ
jgi:hypothetical protein